MKQPFLLIFASLFVVGATAHAQPTLTASGINPVVGETYSSYNGNYISPGNSGANQTWDFTALAGSVGETYNVVHPSATPQGNSFPNANLAMVAPSGLTRYFNTSAAALQNFGTVSPQVVPLTDPEDLLRFPFTYGNSFTDPWSGQFTQSGYTNYRSGTITVTADGYGTLITPVGTFANVLRVHIVEDYRDSIDLFGTPLIVTYLNDQYMWYQDGAHLILASTFALTSGGTTYSGANYSTPGAVNVDAGASATRAVQLYPQPASDHVTLELDLAKHALVDVSVSDAMGQVVLTHSALPCGAGLNRLPLRVDQLPAGVYFAQLAVGGQPALTKRFVVSR